MKKYVEVKADSNVKRLVGWFKPFSSAAVAFSGGVDSSLLAYAARTALGNKAIAVASVSPSFAREEISQARQVASEIGIRLVEVAQDDLSDENYTKNGVMRCYFCRSNLVVSLRPILLENSIEVCVDGTHAEDMKSPRPGVRALREAGFRAPLLELGFDKNAVRQSAKSAGLSCWDRPSEACLSSRVAYGNEITLEKLRKIEAAELVVKAITRASIVRVRIIGAHASVEVDKESVHDALLNRHRIQDELEKIGFASVEIDQDGYTPGKMLELFAKSKEQ